MLSCKPGPPQRTLLHQARGLDVRGAFISSELSLGLRQLLSCTAIANMSHASPTPSTRTHDSFPQHGRFAAPRPNSHTANPSNPVPIPNAQDSPPAPPPLPPPTTIDGLDSGRDLAWQFANGHQQRHFDHSTPNSHQSLHNRPSDGGDRVTIGATSVGGPREGEERYRSPPRNRYHTPTNSFHERDGNADRVGGGDRQGVPKQPVNSNYRSVHCMILDPLTRIRWRAIL